ncbi:MAG: hypothetical protein AAGK80_01490 [Pseudomonadota bacterium]
MRYPQSIPLLALIGFICSACATVPPAAAQADDAQPQPPRCDYGAPHPDAPDALEQFAFLIGDFEITSHIMTPTGWSPPRPGPRARWNGWYSMGGMMITDEWYDPDPGLQPESPRGVNVRMYDEASAEWKMMWVSTTGAQVQDLRAGMRDGKLTMWQIYPTEIELVADFTVEDADHWHRISYVKDDAGEWIPQYKLAARRIACDAAP